MRSVVVALGGNAIIPQHGSGTIEEQYDVSAKAMAQVAGLVGSGARVLITHGNGPIVGNIMIRNEAAKDRIPPMPLFICDADSQGGIGLMIQQVLSNELHRLGCPRQIVTVVTQVVVDRDDPAFGMPTKPIGPFYTEEDASILARERRWYVREDAKRGYRRVVPSPAPQEIVEAEIIRTLLDANVVVVAAGGGGVPVFREPDGTLHGVDAVVDKDRTACELARLLDFDSLVFVTGTDRVYLNFGTDHATPLDVVTLAELRRYHDEGHFPSGSMGPKIDAAISFLSSGGREVIVASPSNLLSAFEGTSGTRIQPDPTP